MLEDGRCGLYLCNFHEASPWMPWMPWMPEAARLRFSNFPSHPSLPYLGSSGSPLSPLSPSEQAANCVCCNKPFSLVSFFLFREFWPRRCVVAAASARRNLHSAPFSCIVYGEYIMYYVLCIMYYSICGTITIEHREGNRRIEEHKNRASNVTI